MRIRLPRRFTRSGHAGYRRFIVLTRSRTGSNVLISYLDSHPNIRARGEVLRTLRGRPYTDILARQFRPQPRTIMARGFKVFYYHPLDDPASDLLDHLAAMPDLAVIHLKRRNVLRTLVSRQIAGRQAVWKVTDPAALATGPRDDKRVAFTVDALQRGFEQTRQWERGGDARFRDHPLLPVAYEDLAAAPASEFRRITTFLDVPYVSPSTSLLRQNPEPLRDLIADFDTLATAFRGTEWEPLFEDG